MNLIFFDMKGPLSIYDNTRALMKLIPNCSPIIDTVQRYDRQRSNEEDDYYDPSDDLAIIAPFPIHHSIIFADIAKLADADGLMEPLKIDLSVR